jgi:hypothetical protein
MPFQNGNRPVVAILQDSGSTMPADVLAAFQCTRPDGGLQDLFFVRMHVFALGAHKQTHPLVPSCRYVRLGPQYAVVPVNNLLHPVRLIPNVSPHSRREPTTKVHSRHTLLFWLPDLM